jgi:hypothetical protein
MISDGIPNKSCGIRRLTEIAKAAMSLLAAKCWFHYAGSNTAYPNVLTRNALV